MEGGGVLARKRRAGKVSGAAESDSLPTPSADGRIDPEPFEGDPRDEVTRG